MLVMQFAQSHSTTEWWDSIQTQVSLMGKEKSLEGQGGDLRKKQYAERAELSIKAKHVHLSLFLKAQISKRKEFIYGICYISGRFSKTNRPFPPERIYIQSESKDLSHVTLDEPLNPLERGRLETAQK